MRFWEEDSYMREDDRYEPVDVCYSIHYTGLKTKIFDSIKNYLKSIRPTKK